MGRKNKYVPKCNWYDVYANLKELYMSSFTWEGVPPSVNVRFLELNLMQGNYMGYFYDDVMKEYLVLPTTQNGKLDVYYEPTKVRAYGANGYQYLGVNHKDVVLIYNNNLRNSPLRRLKDYAWRIWNIERTIDINVHAQKTPIILKTSRQLELTLRNILSQYENFEPNIVIDKNLEIEEALTAIKVDVPYMGGDLFELKKKVWNEALSYIGIENNSSEKRERLVEAELLVSNGLAIANRTARLSAREKACEEINRLFYAGKEVVTVKANNLSYIRNGIIGAMPDEERED